MLLAVDAGNTDTVIGLYDLSVTVNSTSNTSASVTVSPGAPASQGTVSLSGNQLRFVAAAIPGTPDPTGTGQVLRAAYVGGDQCAPLNRNF